jgi:hypothetical protein
MNKPIVAILSVIALFFAPVIIEVLPKNLVDVLATLTMLGLCLTLAGLFLWIGLKK